MDYQRISEWLSENINRPGTSIYLVPEIWKYILIFTQYWKQGCWHSKILKDNMPDNIKDDSLEWYGHYWLLKGTPWIETYWSGNRGLEYEVYPLESPRGFQIIERKINNDIWSYFGVNDCDELFPLTESFPDWASKIIKFIYQESDLSLREVSNIHLLN